MPVFLDYFNTSVLAYNEQIVERIRRWFCPFDDTIHELTGLTANEALSIYTWFGHRMQNQLDTLSKLAKEEKKLRLSFCEQWEKEGWSLPEARKRAQDHPIKDAVLKLINSSSSLFYVTRDEMCEKFNRKLIEKLWKYFVSNRSFRDFRFITQDNPAEIRPLFSIDCDTFFCPCIDQFLRAVFQFLLRTMRNSDKWNSFARRRHKAIVEKATQLFSDYFGETCAIFKSVYEGPDSQKEHDIIVLYKCDLFIVEVKTTPQKEPFYNPDKAFVRIKRDFKSDQGIQKAYDQTLGLKQYILNSHPAIVYDKNGRVLLRLTEKNFYKIHSICLTADRYGIIGVNLSLLLNKPDREPFPWSCDLYSLEVLLDGFKSKRPSPDFFLDYLGERARLHKKFVASDELEIAGFYLKQGSFEEFERKKGDIFMFTPDASDIFDDIYFKKHGSNYLPYREDFRPIITDVGEELRQMTWSRQTDKTEFSTNRGTGRNESCPCGSGKKFKHCHGRHGS